MEQENFETNQEEVPRSTDHLESLKKITPVSKYLALILFIILPFLGGWIGYTYAPDKVVEVEKIVLVHENVSLKKACPAVNGKHEYKGFLLTDEEVCYKNYLLEGSDIETFQYVRQMFTSESGERVVWNDQEGLYAFDKNYFYEDGKIKYSTENGTYKYFGVSSIAIENVVYGDIGVPLGPVMMEPVFEADAGTFEALGYGYTRDKRSTFYLGYKIENAVPAIFTVVEYEYITEPESKVFILGKVQDKIFFHNQYLEGINFSEMVIDSTNSSFLPRYIRDVDTVYFLWTPSISSPNVAAEYRLGNLNDI